MAYDINQILTDYKNIFSLSGMQIHKAKQDFFRKYNAQGLSLANETEVMRDLSGAQRVFRMVDPMRGSAISIDIGNGNAIVLPKNGTVTNGIDNRANNLFDNALGQNGKFGTPTIVKNRDYNNPIIKGHATNNINDITLSASDMQIINGTPLPLQNNTTSAQQQQPSTEPSPEPKPQPEPGPASQTNQSSSPKTSSQSRTPKTSTQGAPLHEPSTTEHGAAAKSGNPNDINAEELVGAQKDFQAADEKDRLAAERDHKYETAAQDAYDDEINQSLAAQKKAAKEKAAADKAEAIKKAGGIDEYYAQLADAEQAAEAKAGMEAAKQERAHQQKLSTEVASRAKAEEVAKTHADAAQKRINDATGVSNGGRHLSSQETNDIVGLFTRQGQYASGKGYNTENDAVLGEKIRKARKDFMEKNGGKAGDFDEALRKNPGMILDENDKGLLGDLNTFLERKDLAQQNVTVYKKDLQNRLKKIEDRTKGKSFEDLRYQEGGKGFLSKAETEAIQKKTTGMHGLGARLRDNLGKAVNKATFGHAHVRTNRAEEIRNTEAQKVVNQRRGAIKNQIKSAGQQLQDIKEYREDAIEGGRSRNAIRKYRRNEVKQQKKAAAAKKAGKLNLGWKGKAGAVAALLGVGAVLGNMMGNHGEQSNAQLYNPNPQPQYAN